LNHIALSRQIAYKFLLVNNNSKIRLSRVITRSQKNQLKFLNKKQFMTPGKPSIFADSIEICIEKAVLTEYSNMIFE